VLGKIIKYGKTCEENEENLAIFNVILMAAFGTKNVHSDSSIVYFFGIRHPVPGLYIYMSHTF